MILYLHRNILFIKTTYSTATPPIHSLPNRSHSTRKSNQERGGSPIPYWPGRSPRPQNKHPCPVSLDPLRLLFHNSLGSSHPQFKRPRPSSKNPHKLGHFLASIVETTHPIGSVKRSSVVKILPSPPRKFPYHPYLPLPEEHDHEQHAREGPRPNGSPYRPGNQDWIGIRTPHGTRFLLIPTHPAEPIDPYPDGKSSGHSGFRGWIEPFFPYTLRFSLSISPLAIPWNTMGHLRRV